MPISIADMQPGDHDAMFALWQQSEGVGLTPSDSRAAIEMFLARNPGLSVVARDGATLVGAVLCGHDGRRGFLYHLAVARAYQRRGIARALMETCLGRLAAAGIRKTTIFVYAHNQAGQEFWCRTGWKERTDLLILQRELA